MDCEMLSNLLQPRLADAALAANQAARLRASLEDHVSVLPADVMDKFETLVESLRDLATTSTMPVWIVTTSAFGVQSIGRDQERGACPCETPRPTVQAPIRARDGRSQMAC